MHLLDNELHGVANGNVPHRNRLENSGEFPIAHTAVSRLKSFVSYKSF